MLQNLFGSFVGFPLPIDNLILLKKKRKKKKRKRKRKKKKKKKKLVCEVQPGRSLAS